MVRTVGVEGWMFWVNTGLHALFLVFGLVAILRS